MGFLKHSLSKCILVSMTLTIDIGNTNIVSGIFHEDALIHHWRLVTKPENTIDDYQALFHSIFSLKRIEKESISRIVIGSVVPELTGVFRELCSLFFSNPPLLVHPDLDLGIEINIDDPYELGPDLIANGVSGYTKTGRACVIIDFGTALTFTAVSGRGIIEGVSIAPGMRTALAALSGKTALLPHVDLEVPPSVIGKNTIHSIQSGILFGYMGIVEGIVKQMKKELDSPVIIATGGMVRIIEGKTKCIDLVEPWLTLQGLRIISERNL